MKFSSSDAKGKQREITEIKTKLASVFKDTETTNILNRLDIENVEQVMKDIIAAKKMKITAGDKTYSQVADELVRRPPISEKASEMLSKEFTSGVTTAHSILEVEKIFKEEIDKLKMKATSRRQDDSKLEDKIKKGLTHTIDISFSLTESDIKGPVTNILREGGSDALFNNASQIDNIMNKIATTKETITTDIISKISGGLETRPRDSDKEKKEQIMHFKQKMKNNITVNYDWKPPKSCPNSSCKGTRSYESHLDELHVKKLLEGYVKYLNALSALLTPGYEKTPKINETAEEEKPVANTKKTESEAFAKSRESEDKTHGAESASERYKTDDYFEEGDTREEEETGKDDDIPEKTTGSFLDTFLSYFKSEDSTDPTDSTESVDKTESPANLVKSLDVTGLFSRDTKFVPTELDNQKIEIAESDLKRLQSSEETLRQELAEQTQRIHGYKQNIQNKISQQYALLDYEKKQLIKDGQEFDGNNRDKYYELVDALRNRERFLDKREEILNEKREKDIKVVEGEKKRIVSDLLRQLDKEKNIIIRNKNRENDVLKRQVAYYKGNIRNMETIVSTMGNCNDKKMNNIIQKGKRTLKKRKKIRSENYTDSKLFEITL